MSETWKEYQRIAPNLAIPILEAIEENLRHEFEKLRKERISQNTKGKDYEDIVKEFFEMYVGSAFNFQTRVGVLDSELKVLSILKHTENEFDVVALYKNAVPKLVHRHLVPYDSVAFIIEVKQTLKFPELEEDLQKFGKLNALKTDETRFNFSNMFPKNLVLRPIRAFFTMRQTLI